MNQNENEIVVEAWNTVLFDKFLRFKHLLVAGLSGHSDEFLSRGSLPAGRARARRGLRLRRLHHPDRAPGRPAGRGGRRGLCREFHRGERAGCRGCRRGERPLLRRRRAGTTTCAARTTMPLHASGRCSSCRPVAALRNIRRALKPAAVSSRSSGASARTIRGCTTRSCASASIVPVVSHEEADQVHCGPGPFSMAGPDMVSAMMKAAGFERVAFERYDTDICIGRDLDDAIEFAMALGPAGEIIRLAGAEGERLKPQVVAALRETLARYERKTASGRLPAPGSSRLGIRVDWSERRDLNSRPLAPHASALPGCATLRHWNDSRSGGRRTQRRRILSSSSSSARIWRMTCRACVLSSRASSPSSRLRAPPMVKPSS